MRVARKLKCTRRKVEKSRTNFGVSAKYGRSYDCKECANKRAKEARERRLKAGLCALCTQESLPGLTKCSKHSIHSAGYGRHYYAINKEGINKRGKLKRVEVRLAAFDAYGGRFCACCSEASYEFLSIDHMLGGGRKHREELSRKGISDLCGWLKRQNYPSGYRVLCHNCNQAIGHYGYCPHDNERGGNRQNGVKAKKA